MTLLLLHSLFLESWVKQETIFIDTVVRFHFLKIHADILDISEMFWDLHSDSKCSANPLVGEFQVYRNCSTFL